MIKSIIHAFISATEFVSGKLWVNVVGGLLRLIGLQFPLSNLPLVYSVLTASIMSIMISLFKKGKYYQISHPLANHLNWRE